MGCIFLAKFKFKYEKASKKIDFSACKNALKNSQIINAAHFEMFSNRELIIEGCKKILDYTNQYIKLQLEKGSILICGEHLEVISFEVQSIIIRGAISNLEFCV